ncbi:MAG: flavodoxin family protein, partial [Spirochaetales bacterium]|nr:flavodoxin family protein [Spirochaetales bacterium]
EGLQVMRNLGANLAWLLQSIAAGKKAGLAAPEAERRFVTNYIR